jgi:hypothetical protein
MAQNDRKRQQKAMKKRQKDNAKKKHLAQTRAASPESAFYRKAGEYPLYECLLGGDLDEGIALITVVRRQSEHLLTGAVFIVDTHCLGLKNTYCWKDRKVSDYVMKLRPRHVEEFNAQTATLERVHQIIHGAIDYARDLDFRPHADFRITRHFIGESDAFQRDQSLEFGKDGKPFYFGGPRDNYAKIVRHLEKRLGIGGFHYVLPLDGAPEELLDRPDARIVSG